MTVIGEDATLFTIDAVAVAAIGQSQQVVLTQIEIIVEGAPILDLQRVGDGNGPYPAIIDDRRRPRELVAGNKVVILSEIAKDGGGVLHPHILGGLAFIIAAYRIGHGIIIFIGRWDWNRHRNRGGGG